MPGGQRCVSRESGWPARCATAPPPAIVNGGVKVGRVGGRLLSIGDQIVYRPPSFIGLQPTTWMVRRMYRVDVYLRVRRAVDGGGDEHPGDCADVWPAPGYGAQNAGLFGAAGLSPTVSAWKAQVEALHRRHRPDPGGRSRAPQEAAPHRSERLTGALLDRLTHHVHILEMNGESYRLKRSRENAAAQAPDESDNP